MRISDWSSDVCSSDLVDEDPYPQLRLLKISQNGCGAAKFLLRGADRCNPRRMIGMVAMAHIDAESIGSGKIKFADNLRAIVGRTQRCPSFDLARSWAVFFQHIPHKPEAGSVGEKSVLQ